MESIVVGVDNSEVSTRAVEFAADRSLRNDWKVVLVHVIPWSPYSFQTPSENEHRHRQRTKEIEAAQDQIIAPMAAILDQAGVSHDDVIIHGRPSEAMIDLAKERGAVHIIVGRTGDSGLREAVFGSVASRLVQHAPVPVTVMP
ncbi:universal stress protein [Janibacter sp. GXQ6167]|uniref:universal stress protein n=1 Tax=Janibacter sp. GXQ6167 TaxID=3240791 RepID=UPI00352627D3